MKNHLALILVEYGRIQSTSLRSIVVDRASFAVVKDASARPILEALVSVPLKDEKTLSETEVLDPSYIFTTQWHLRFKTTLSAPVMQTHVHAAHLPRKAGSVTVLPIIARFC